MKTEFIEIGIISEVNIDRARVKIGDMVTDFLPIVQIANSFTRTFTPIRVGEQVVVLPVRGSLNSGVILRSVYQEAFGAPSTETKTQICTFEDGVSISYDTSSSTLNISTPKQINITCESANLTAQSVNVTANDTTVKSPNIKLLGNTLVQGAILTTGNGGGAGSFEINGNVNITGSITTGGNANFGGSVSDSRGSLTNHTNNGLARD
ncbi:phage baseplate assembly protein V [Campylobacter hyointestinalis]|uniref:phage baseplate assembly protein V n=1 Tax=Campylobacter hyointestinalis TaxID=198 RepID=UPI001BD2BD42|nr:phage baseplate assembly protein V [Campylobacter hyointestinalis]MBT0611955.1 phage baseplate assembly protein V [Campylobacter hyointestinalis subsp. hyointestinalis]MDY2999462.1 phage baseplate assembly protein V [Campylobacter hyointestinalis]